MTKNKIKIISILIIILSIVSINVNVFAHSGRTDVNGGHKDNNNKSGLGSYHYHCGGYPPHLHTNGICPYSPSSSTSVNSTSTSSNKSINTNQNSSENTNTNTNENTKTSSPEISIDEIEINEKITSIEVGKSKTLTVTVTPNNATDKSIIWKSSNEDIITVSKTGKIVAKKSGIANITASSSNGKTSTIKINVNEEMKAEDSNILGIASVGETNDINKVNDNQKSLNPLGSTIILGILGGGIYLGCKKLK